MACLVILLTLLIMAPVVPGWASPLQSDPTAIDAVKAQSCLFSFMTLSNSSFADKSSTFDFRFLFSLAFLLLTGSACLVFLATGFLAAAFVTGGVAFFLVSRVFAMSYLVLG